MKAKTDAAGIVDRLEQEYRTTVANLRNALKDFIAGGPPPDKARRINGDFSYPELRLYWPAGEPFPRIGRAYARIGQPGHYAITITRPHLFRDYLIEQLSLLMQDFKVEIEVARSKQEMPFPYVLDAQAAELADVSTAEIARHFPTTELAFIGDEIVDGSWAQDADQPRPLALFDGLRTDFSLARLTHYTGAPAEHVQQFILFTNYHRYVDEFVRWGIEQLGRADSPYEGLSCSGGLMITADTANPELAVA
ncbi:MAG: AMP nucleosidase, partial [Bradyrhizobium sp.]